MEMLRRVGLMLLALLLLCSPLSGTTILAQEERDEYEQLRIKWAERLTGGSDYDSSDPDIASRIRSIDEMANQFWSQMNADKVWDELLDINNPANITALYDRLYKMTLAWSTKGSQLENNQSLKNDIIAGLDWVYANRYNENLTPPGHPHLTWWHWEIGGPLFLKDIAVLLYNELSAQQIQNYMNAINKFTPNATRVVFNTRWATGANLIWKAQIVAIRAIVVEDEAKIAHARDALKPVFRYATTGDGFYRDGSFIQHSIHPYTGGYGRSISYLTDIMRLLHGSFWEIKDPNHKNLYQWIYDSFEPYIYKGTMLEEVRGREISRQGTDNHRAGHDVIQTIVNLSQIESEHSLNFKRMVKYWLMEDTYANYYDGRDIEMIQATKEIMNDDSIAPREELITHKQFHNMDRAVHLRPGFAFSISMSSNRIATYESINNENINGWHTGDGATYLHNGALNEYSGNYWPTVDPYRLAGTTVSTKIKPDAGGTNYLSPSPYAGGTSISDLYGVAGMVLRPWNSTLEARKAWFMFDDEVVALGSGITSDDGHTLETIYENRKLGARGNEELTVAEYLPLQKGTECRQGSCDGKRDNSVVQKYKDLGWEKSLENVHWMHLEGTGGYYFPEPASIQAKREKRTGSWYDINRAQSKAVYTNNYLTFWKDHGVNPNNDTYSYVLLPNKSKEETRHYIQNPDITILANSKDVAAVKENKLNITAAAFWEDKKTTVGKLTSHNKAAVVMKEIEGSEIEIAVSDPTQKNNGKILIELSEPAKALLSQDERIAVTQLKPYVKFYVNVNSSKGQTYRVKFSTDPNAPQDTTSPAPVTDLAVAYTGTDTVNVTFTAPGDDGLEGKASTYDLRYTTSPITEENWDSAVSVGELFASSPGTKETFTLFGLQPGTTYYFAVKTKDEVPNISEISNVASTTTNATLLFKDDFNDGNTDGWKAYAGNWIVDQGEYSQTSTGAYGYRSTIGNLAVSDAIIEFKLRILNNGGKPWNWSGLQFRKTLPEHSFSNSGYMVFYTDNGELKLFKAGKGEIAKYPTGIAPKDFVKIKVAAIGSKIDIYFNDSVEPVISVTDSGFSKGYIGLITGKTYSNFDDVKVQ
jgi:hyaluronate lyase